MPTFHPFPRLPLELRIHIWTLACTPRTLKIHSSAHLNRSYWSPTPVPAVTRACQEARLHSSYRRVYLTACTRALSRYIWTCSSHDVVQIRGHMLEELSDGDSNSNSDAAARDHIVHLRIDLTNNYKEYEAEFFFYKYCHRIPCFPRLHSIQVLVEDGLRTWTQFICETHWGACPQANVRIVDGATGEWFDHGMSGVYADWADNGWREDGYYAFTRIADDEEESFEVRVQAVRRFAGLPRMEVEW